MLIPILLIGPAIWPIFGIQEPTISERMSAALKKSVPGFVTWKTSDYSLAVQTDAARRNAVPWMISLEVNGDTDSDIVLDGHDGEKSILLCLISDSTGYRVVVIKVEPMRKPKTIESWNDGKQEEGLNYFLWTYKDSTGFTLGFPQQSDPSGNLLNDGAIFDYVFKNGRFEEHYQVP